MKYVFFIKEKKIKVAEKGKITNNIEKKLVELGYKKYYFEIEAKNSKEAKEKFIEHFKSTDELSEFTKDITISSIILSLIR